MEVQLVIVDRQVNRLAELENATLESFTWSLYGDGGASFSIPSGDPKAKLLRGWKHEVQIWLDGWLAWWGVLWRKRGTPGQSVWECEELLSLFKKRYIDTSSLLFTSIEQFNIAFGLSSYAQAGLYRDLNIDTANVQGSGKIRSREYSRNEHTQIFDALQEFHDLNDGFDVGVRFYGDGRRELMCWYPGRGVPRPKLRLEYGRNISDFTITTDSIPQANDWWATGGSNGDVRFEGHYTDEAYAAEWGMMTEISSEGSMLDPDWLEDRALGHVNLQKNPTVIPEIEAVEIPVALLGEVEVGDTVPILIDDGDNYVNNSGRIETITFSPDSETLSVGFVGDKLYEVAV